MFPTNLGLTYWGDNARGAGPKGVVADPMLRPQAECTSGKTGGGNLQKTRFSAIPRAGCRRGKELGGQAAPASRIRSSHGSNVVNFAVPIVQRGVFGPSDSRQGAAGCIEGIAAIGTQRSGSRRRGRGHLSPPGVKGWPNPNVAAGRLPIFSIT